MAEYLLAMRFVPTYQISLFRLLSKWQVERLEIVNKKWARVVLLPEHSDGIVIARIA